MLQQTGKSKKFFFYIILFLFLSTTQNLKIDNKISNLKNIKYIQVEGSNLKLNLSIENELKKLIDKNIFFLKKKIFLEK